MLELIDKIIESRNVVPVGLMCLGFVAIVCGAIRSVVGSVVRERTRREIAAFIAEGSMTPEQGEKLMAAGQPKNPGCC